MITIILETRDADIRLEMPAIPRAGDYIHRVGEPVLRVMTGTASWECEQKKEWFAHLSAEIVEPNQAT